MNPSHRIPEHGEPPYGPTEELQEDTSIRLRSYWLMIFERRWYALTVFLLTLLVVGTYTFLSTPVYQSQAMVQVLRRGSQVLRGADVVESTIGTDTDFNTQMKVIESLTMVQSVVARLNADEIKTLTDPYKKWNREPLPPVEVIYKHRKIVTQRLTLMLGIVYEHPDPKMAARIANLFAEEYIAYNSRVRAEESMHAVDELKDRADQQRKRVDEIANSLQAFRERGNLISLVQSKDIVTERLKALNLMATQTNAKLKESEARWNQVQEWTKNNRDLNELPFIAIQPQVAQLSQQVAKSKIEVAELKQRYRAKHPRMIEAANSLHQAESELDDAIHVAAASVKSEYDNALQNDVDARKALADQETKSLDLDKSGVEYENLNREFKVNEQLLESMMGRMREASVTSSIDTQQARIVDHAVEATSPVSPRIWLNLAAGVVGGVILGLGFAYLIALVDDRVKNTFDVETLVRLPLIGMIPHVKRMDQPDKAQIVANGADRAIVESFLSIYSSLRINDDSRNAKLLLITSTLPSEGKSFVSSNLALAFASQGQRTVIVDCDLRKPNIHKSFRLKATQGVIGHCVHGVPLDDVIVRGVHPNLDVIVAGGRAVNPYPILNGLEFEKLVTELGRRYDRVLFDTPPLGAVSDALNILPMMDGAIYTIQYNRVRRTAAQRCVSRLLAASVPVFGAILNDTDAGAADYYGEYHNKAYQDYYDLSLTQNRGKSEVQVNPVE
ncbi:MAG TPA: polysaccharide biosynthesis tyrosine autokinase [Opitutaceae bacterium]